jgi:carboxymethylenebutenolidase
MSTTVEFPSNGSTASGYLATPPSGHGPGVIVLQEWWGLNQQIKGVADRLASEGFVALAPDLYHGEVAGHAEMDKAEQLMQSMPPGRAARDMGGAVDHLLAHDAVTSGKVGVIGFCMGGLLTLVVAAAHGDKVGAAVPFYGAPLDPAMEPDWSRLSAPVEGHFAEKDDFFPLDGVRQLEQKLVGMGKDVTFHVYPGAGHAFANEENPLGTRDDAAAERAMGRALQFLASKLGLRPHSA